MYLLLLSAIAAAVAMKVEARLPCAAAIALAIPHFSPMARKSKETH